jgi:hypothetical protein
MTVNTEAAVKTEAAVNYRGRPEAASVCQAACGAALPVVVMSAGSFFFGFRFAL